MRYVIYLVNPMTGEILEEIEPNLHIYGIAFWEDNFIFTSGDGLYKIDFSELVSSVLCLFFHSYNTWS